MPEKKEEAPSVMAQIPPSYRKLVSRTIQRELNVQFCILQEELRQDLAQSRADGQESRTVGVCTWKFRAVLFSSKTERGVEVEVLRCVSNRQLRYTKKS